MFDKENREHWYIRHQQDLEVYIIPTFGDYRLDYIKPQMIENRLMKLKDKNKKAPLTGNTKKILYALREVLDSAVRESYISSNPSRNVMIPSQKPVYERRPLTRYEQKKTLFPPSVTARIEVWDKTSYAAFFSVMYDT